MNKRKTGRTLSRVKSQRTALKRTLLVSLVKYGSVKTTLAKAKELRPYAERMITRAKKAQDESKRMVVLRQLKKEVTTETAGRLIKFGNVFSGRQGGYIRIIKMPFRKSDGADLAMVEWTAKIDEPDKKQKQQKRDKRDSQKDSKKEEKKEQTGKKKELAGQEQDSKDEK